MDISTSNLLCLVGLKEKAQLLQLYKMIDFMVEEEPMMAIAHILRCWLSKQFNSKEFHYPVLTYLLRNCNDNLRRRIDRRSHRILHVKIEK